MESPSKSSKLVWWCDMREAVYLIIMEDPTETFESNAVLHACGTRQKARDKKAELLEEIKEVPGNSIYHNKVRFKIKKLEVI